MRRPRKLSRKGARFVAAFEGFRATPYRAIPSEPHLTIGFGHYGPDVKPEMRWSRRKALRILRKDARWAGQAVRGAVKVPLKQHQFDALVSAVFNLGPGDIMVESRSTLLRHLNAGRYRAAADQLPRWNRAGGSPLAGLTRRRNAERRVFLHGYRK